MNLQHRGTMSPISGPTTALSRSTIPTTARRSAGRWPSGAAELGVCVCGTGLGISMAANKVAGVRAAVVHDVTTATLAKQHNHANVVCFGARTTGTAVVLDALSAFLGAPEEHGRHDGRIAKLADLDRELVHPIPAEGTP